VKRVYPSSFLKIQVDFLGGLLYRKNGEEVSQEPRLAERCGRSENMDVWEKAEMRRGTVLEEIIR
jgi:hypothetical protein